MVELRIKIISIHALREEGDAQIEVKVFDDFLFLSTPSARRATLPIPSNHLEGEYFYPRPPRGGRLAPTLNVSAIVNFYPRPPRGGRHGCGLQRSIGNGISIHALREEGDLRFSFRWSMLAKFLSTPSARRATVVGISVSSNQGISIHALREEGDISRPAPHGT